MPLRFSADHRGRELILEVLGAALGAVDPESAVREALRDRGDWPTVIAIGKAAAAMARGVPRPGRGLVVTNHQSAVPPQFEVCIGGHPLPDESSVAAAEAVLELIERTTGPVLFLISGGASALIELPAGDLRIADLASVTDALLGSGADIAEINCVRKHLSRIKGGRLAAELGDRPSLSLLVSDVVGSDPSVIASGPTVADRTTFGDAIDVLARYKVDVPRAAGEHLAAGEAGRIPETPAQLAGHDVVVVADGAHAAHAAAAAARERGVAAAVFTTELEGDAAESAREVVARAGWGMTILAGETTVEVTGAGLGGRNQHAALAAAIELSGKPGVTFAALATDGIDGQTKAAGAVVDGDSVARGVATGLDPRAALANHDSHRFLDATGDTLWLGPSGTNVGDLWVVSRV